MSVSTGTRVSSGDAGVWVGVDGGQVLRLDPLTAEVVATVEIGDVSAAPLSGDEAVWVVTPGVVDVDTRRPGDQRGDSHDRRVCLGHEQHPRCGDR